jgi:hypothetical protein
MSWADWRDQIASACDGSHWTIDGIEQQIAMGRLHILEPKDCCLLVEVVDYPGARACQVMWAAGNLTSILAASRDVEAWARLQGCTEMLAESRPAWGRALQRIGYSPWSVTSRKPLNGPLH